MKDPKREYFERHFPFMVEVYKSGTRTEALEELETQWALLDKYFKNQVQAEEKPSNENLVYEDLPGFVIRYKGHIVEIRSLLQTDCWDIEIDSVKEFLTEIRYDPEILNDEEAVPAAIRFIRNKETVIINFDLQVIYGASDIHTQSLAEFLLKL